MRRLRAEARARARLGALQLLLGLDSPPERLHRVRVEIAGVAEHVRVAADEFGGDRLDDAAEIEQSRLLGHAGVEDDLQQKVAEFLAKVLGLAALDRVGDLVGFLDRIGGDRGEGLLDVPGTAGLRVAQRGHDLDQAMNVAGRLHRSSPSDGAAREAGPPRHAVQKRKERGFGRAPELADRAGARDQSDSEIASRPFGVSTTRMLTC